MSEQTTAPQPPNGNPKTASHPHITVRVTDLVQFTLAVDGEFPSLDYALNMLQQATRELEAQWRLARAAQYQQQQIAIAQGAQIRRDLIRRH